MDGGLMTTGTEAGGAETSRLPQREACVRAGTSSADWLR